MDSGWKAIWHGAAALATGYVVCRGLGATLPERWITNYDGNFTGFGATLYWLAFTGSAAVVLRLFGYVGEKSQN